MLSSKVTLFEYTCTSIGKINSSVNEMVIVLKITLYVKQWYTSEPHLSNEEIKLESQIGHFHNYLV
jgi:hypothetical protein